MLLERRQQQIYEMLLSSLGGNPLSTTNLSISKARLYGTSLEPKFWVHMVGSWFLRGCHRLRYGQMDGEWESVTDGKWADSRIVLKVSICCGIHLKLVSTTLFYSLPINVHSWLGSVSVASIVYFLPRIQKLRSFNCDNFCAFSVFIFFCLLSLKADTFAYHNY